MVAKTARLGLQFRPHFKTHQSRTIGTWFREAGVKAITVSSVEMGLYFAAAGWQAITLAFPTYPAQMPLINRLAASCQLRLVAESVAELTHLEKRLQHPVELMIKVDVGGQRTGIAPDNTSLLLHLAKQLDRSSKLTFNGFLAHAGHTYRCRTAEQVRSIHEQVILKVGGLRQTFDPSYPGLIYSLGDSPSASLAENFEGIDELRPGVFVFFDWMQLGIGACSYEDMALCMAAPVVALHPDRNEVVIHGGAIHFSKETWTESSGDTHYGPVVLLDDAFQPLQLLEGTFLKKVSQEHGILRTTTETMQRFAPGQWIGVLPVHACLTANLIGSYQTLSGEKIDHFNRQAFI